MPYKISEIDGDTEFKIKYKDLYCMAQMLKHYETSDERDKKYGCDDCKFNCIKERKFDDGSGSIISYTRRERILEKIGKAWRIVRWGRDKIS